MTQQRFTQVLWMCGSLAIALGCNKSADSSPDRELAIRRNNQGQVEKWKKEQEAYQRQIQFADERTEYESKLHLLEKLANAEIAHNAAGDDATTVEKLVRGYKLFGAELPRLNEIISHYWDSWEKQVLQSVRHMMAQPVPNSRSSPKEAQLFAQSLELTALKFTRYRVSLVTLGRKSEEADSLWNEFVRHSEEAAIDLKISGLK